MTSAQLDKEYLSGVQIIKEFTCGVSWHRHGWSCSHRRRRINIYHLYG
jgi:hypothetical protein